MKLARQELPYLSYCHGRLDSVVSCWISILERLFLLRWGVNSVSREFLHYAEVHQDRCVQIAVCTPALLANVLSRLLRKSRRGLILEEK
jgi:hypothetical protein